MYVISGVHFSMSSRLVQREKKAASITNRADDFLSPISIDEKNDTFSAQPRRDGTHHNSLLRMTDTRKYRLTPA